MRHQLNETVFAVYFKFEKQNPIGFFMPYTWDNIPVTEIKFVELTVAEHHKVRWNYDPSDSVPIYDGYVLKDKDGTVFHNQYPFANFEQTQCTSDYLFSRVLPEKESFNPFKTPYQYYSLAYVLETTETRITNFERQLSEYGARETRVKLIAKNKIDLLQALKKRIFEEFESQFPEYNLTLSMSPLDETATILFPVVKIEKK